MAKEDTKTCLAIIGVLFLICFFVLLGPLITMVIWNDTLIYAFKGGLNVISYWQAFMIHVFVWCLFGGNFFKIFNSNNKD